MLTVPQKKLLDYIKSYMAKSDGVGPSFDEMAKGMGHGSKANVHATLAGLEERGFIRRLRYRRRAIEIIRR